MKTEDITTVPEKAKYINAKGLKFESETTSVTLADLKKVFA